MTIPQLAIVISLYFCLLSSAHAQGATVSLFPVVTGEGSLEGQIAGIGPDGTTYILSASPTAGSEGAPVTITLVEDNSHISELAIVPGDDATVSFNAQCTIDAQSIAVCAVESGVAVGGSTELGTRTGTISVQLEPILVSTVDASATSPTSQSQSTITSLISSTRLHKVYSENKQKLAIMAPKKQKMSLNEFLGDSTLGSWADEMDSLPTAPAPRTDDRAGDRGYSRRGDDFLSSKPDRGPAPPRAEVPLPTQPPYTAFVGNLAFDLTEKQLGDYFGTADEVKSAKIIRDREDKPKGFGYVEFNTVEGLKEALNKNGAAFNNRTIRVNVAEPPKERPGGGSFDDEKFSGNWRREGPLPDLPGRDGGRDGSRRRYDGISNSEARESASENNSDWRSNRLARFAAEPENPQNKRRGSGFSTPTPEGDLSPADTEEKWVIGSKFKPAQDSDSRPGSRFGSMRGKSEMGPPPSLPDEGDWRRPRPTRQTTSPGNSVPPTPQMGRRKLELLPRSSSASSQATPLSSPKSAGFSSTKSNPFGAAKPVDVSAREAQVMEKIEKEKEDIKEKVSQHSMSRQSSRQARPRPSTNDAVRSPTSSSGEAASPTTATAATPAPAPVTTSSSVRPTFSFASAAAGRKDSISEAPKEKSSVEEVTEKLEETSV